MSHRIVPLLLSFTIGTGFGAASADDTERAATDTVEIILPGDARFDTPAFGDYEAIYSSASSKTGAFTLHARTSGDGKNLLLLDVIPMADHVIAAQRVIDLASHRQTFGAGPYFAWGVEFVTSQSTDRAYDWTRTPIGGGEPVRMAGEIQHGGYVSDMFSPTLAALLPLEIGTVFRMPSSYPRKQGFVSAELDEYEVLRKERLTLPAGMSCDCWVIEKRDWGSEYRSKTLLWIAREPPFVFRRHRDVGGNRDFVSDLLGYRTLER